MAVDVPQFVNLPDKSTPVTAENLNEWGAAVKGNALAAEAAVVEAEAQVDFLAAPAIEQVAGYVGGTGGDQVVNALDGLRGRRFQNLSGVLFGHETRIILGSEHNAINADSGDAVILGGGRALMENVIGGQEENINNFAVSNLPADKTVAADYAVILGGYDNVNNSLA